MSVETVTLAQRLVSEASLLKPLEPGVVEVQSQLAELLLANRSSTTFSKMEEAAKKIEQELDSTEVGHSRALDVAEALFRGSWIFLEITGLLRVLQTL